MAVRDGRSALAVGDVVDGAGDGRDDAERTRRLARELGRIAAGADRLDAAHLRLDADERRDLARVPAQHGDVDRRRGCASRSRCGRRSRRRRPGRARRGRRSRSPPLPASSIASIQLLRERADVEHERTGEPDHLAHLLPRVRHHRQRAEREDRVRGLVHDDVVGDVVDERLALADRQPSVAPGSMLMPLPFTSRTSTGPSPAPISTRPLRTAAEAAAAAPRAASSSESPRASSAASVAECVQPAPCVAGTS